MSGRLKRLQDRHLSIHKNSKCCPHPGVCLQLYSPVSSPDFLCHTMRFIIHTTMILAAAFGANAAVAPSCQTLCDGVPECAADPGYHGSYCKDWQSIPVCFGIYSRADGSLCFQPNDPTCDDMVLPPVTCSSVVITTTLAPTTVEPTTDAPTTVV